MVDALGVPGSEVLIGHRTDSVTGSSSVERHALVDERAHAFADVTPVGRDLAAPQVSSSRELTMYVGYLYLGFAAHWRGDWVEADRHLRRAVQLEPPGAFEGQSAAHLAVYLAHSGRVEEAVTIPERYGKGPPLPGRIHILGTLNSMFVLTEALYMAGRIEEAAALSTWFEEPLAAGPVGSCSTVG